MQAQAMLLKLASHSESLSNGFRNTTTVSQQVFVLPEMFNAPALKLEASFSVFVQVSSLEEPGIKCHLYKDKGSNL